MAFCSAWIVLLHPPLADEATMQAGVQWGNPDGGPAYPLEIILPSLAIIAPTAFLPQVDLSEVMRA